MVPRKSKEANLDAVIKFSGVDKKPIFGLRGYDASRPAMRDLFFDIEIDGGRTIRALLDIGCDTTKIDSSLVQPGRLMKRHAGPVIGTNGQAVRMDGATRTQLILDPNQRSRKINLNCDVVSLASDDGDCILGLDVLRHYKEVRLDFDDSGHCAIGAFWRSPKRKVDLSATLPKSANLNALVKRKRLWFT